MFAVISDVHSNLEALVAVLEDIGKLRIREIFFLGDAVGYGPDPNGCLALLQKNCSVMLAGNHDRAAMDLREAQYFNTYAQAAVEWTAGVLTEPSKKTLKGLPVMEVMGERDILLVHSSPNEPELWHYISSASEAEDAFEHFDERTCLVGHSHVPFIAERQGSGRVRSYRDSAEFLDGARYIINAGSVGQPRDGDPRACYLAMNDRGAGIRRVEYDIEKTQEKMSAAGLPEMLIKRLSVGR